MGQTRSLDPVVLVVAAFSGYPEVLDWARSRLVELFGPVAQLSLPFDFHQTEYYQTTMGPGLKKQFLAFQNLVKQDCLATVKLQTNRIEEELADGKKFSVPRPLNLDPGLLSLGKFLLASTKDQAHRIYLQDGIFAEVTLRFEAGAFEPWPWTYADYREPEVREFLKEVREAYYSRIRGKLIPTHCSSKGTSGETEPPS